MSQHIFKIVSDGNLYRWQRQFGCTRWISRSAWLSDIEAATSAFKVATTYPQSELRIDMALADAVNVWRTVTQYAATVSMKDAKS